MRTGPESTKPDPGRSRQAGELLCNLTTTFLLSPASCCRSLCCLLLPWVLYSCLPPRPMPEAPPHTVVLPLHGDPASAAVPPHTTAPPPHFRAAPAGALGPGLRGSGLRLPTQGIACSRRRRRRRSLLGSGWSLVPERTGESEQPVLAALCDLPRAASGPRVSEPSPPQWGPLRAAPPPWPAR